MGTALLGLWVKLFAEKNKQFGKKREVQMPTLMVTKTWGSHLDWKGSGTVLNKNNAKLLLLRSPCFADRWGSGTEKKQTVSEVNCISMKTHFQSNVANYKLVLCDFPTPPKKKATGTQAHSCSPNPQIQYTKRNHAMGTAITRLKK